MIANCMEKQALTAGIIRGSLGLTIVALIIWLAGLAGAKEVSAAVLVQFGADMKYLTNTSDPGIGLSWTDSAYDDSGWAEGAYGVGYQNGSSGAENLLNTTVTSGAYSVYTRVAFNIVDVDAVDNLFLGADYDDGYIAWINGTEVYRSPEMPVGNPSYNTAPSGHESSNASSPNYNPLQDITTVGKPALQNGVNVLAVGVWNIGTTSSDLVLVPRLSMNESMTVTRGPYLQRGSPTEVLVRWRTDIQTNSRVRYWTADDPSTVYEEIDSTTTTEHRVALTGLSAETQYYYSVGTSTETLAGDDADHFFLTSPPPGTAKPSRIWILGDSGTANANAEAVRDRYLEYTGSIHTDLWLMLGDNAYPDGTDSEYQEAVFDMYPSMLKKSVLWPTLGNHDAYTGTPGDHPYYDIFSLPRNAEAGGLASGTEAYYSFDYGNIHLICLDSHETERSAGGTMMTWLENDLAQTTQDWIIAFWHHPPYSKGSHDSDSLLDSGGRMVDMREHALPILEDYGVDLVLTGHSHSYERSYLIDGHYGYSPSFDATMLVDGSDGNPGSDGPYEKRSIDGDRGAVYAVAGSSGLTSGGSLDHPVMAVSYNQLGSVVLDINNDQLEARFVDSTGAELDNFTIIKSNCTTTPGSIDTDSDGVVDSCDNCILAPNGPLIPDAGGNSQLDTDGDGYGNLCDCDFTGEGFCGGPDFTVFIGCFNQVAATPQCMATDMNGDGFVGGPDFTLFIGGFNDSVGPSGLVP